MRQLTARQLIALLQEEDPEAPVYYYDHSGEPRPFTQNDVGREGSVVFTTDPGDPERSEDFERPLPQALNWIFT